MKDLGVEKDSCRGRFPLRLRILWLKELPRRPAALEVYSLLHDNIYHVATASLPAYSNKQIDASLWLSNLLSCPHHIISQSPPSARTQTPHPPQGNSNLLQIIRTSSHFEIGGADRVDLHRDLAAT